MRVTVAVIVMLVALLGAARAEMGFGEFVTTFNKTYVDEAERTYRETIFNATVERITRENANPNATFQQKVTQFADRTPEQIAYSEMKQPSIGNVRKGEVKMVSAPSSINWVDKGKVGGVGDQGKCGSCWAFASTSTAQSYLAIKSGTLTALSDEYVLECTSSTCDCGGCDLLSPMLLIGQYGTQKESQYPYLAASYSSSFGSPSTPGICNSPSIKLQNTFVNAYLDISDSQAQSLLSASPFMSYFYASGIGFSSYASGVYSGCPTGLTKYDMNHAVEVVGYDDNGNYIIKNSWGTSWGNGGYAVISKNRDCGIKTGVVQFDSSWQGCLVFGWGILAILLALM